MYTYNEGTEGCLPCQQAKYGRAALGTTTAETAAKALPWLVPIVAVSMGIFLVIYLEKNKRWR